MAELEAELKKRDEQHAAQLEEAVAAAREDAIATGKRKVPGQVKLTLESPSGDAETAAYCIRDGHPTVRYTNNQVVAAQALMKVAQGKALTDQEKSLNPSLASATQKDVLAFLAEMAARKMYWLVKVAPMLLLLLLLSFGSASAQIGNGRIFDFYSDGIDTLTNADTLILTIPKELVDKETYEYAWHLDATNVDDTTNLTIYVQESMFPDLESWINKDTVAISGTEQVFVTGYNTGIRHRLWIRSANTGITKLYAIVRFRKKA